MSSNFIIRVLGSCDYEQHVALLEQLTVVQPITREQYAETINSLENTFIFVCIDTQLQRLVGTITVLIEQKIIHSIGKVAHIEDVVVDNDYRGRGIGKKLVDHAVSFSQSQHCYKVILDCKEELREFYSKSGFESKNIQMSLYF